MGTRMDDSAGPWAMNFSFEWSSTGKMAKTKWELAVDTPCQTCGTPTRRIAKNVKHDIAASCCRKHDKPIQQLDGLKEIVTEGKE